MKNFGIAIALCAALAASMCPQRAAAFAQNLANPSYFYPPSYWPQLDAGAPVVHVAVMNPSSGPGSSIDSNYVTAVQNAQAAGILVLGYVYTQYGSRAASSVEADVQAYESWYHVNGIFFDQASNSVSEESYYSTIYKYVKGYGSSQTVAINPGTQTDQGYMSDCDILVNFEGTYSTYSGSFSANPSWVASYPPSRFWHIIDACPDDSTETELYNAVSLSKQRNAGYVYVTPDGTHHGNPYDTLPSNPFWTDELGALAAN
jgi:hypothetical protein